MYIEIKLTAIRVTEKKNSNICLAHNIRFKCPNVVFGDLARVSQCTHKMCIYINKIYTHTHNTRVYIYILYYLHIHTIIPGRGRVKLFMGDGSAAAVWSLVFVAVVWKGENDYYYYYCRKYDRGTYFCHVARGMKTTERRRRRRRRLRRQTGCSSRDRVGARGRVRILWWLCGCARICPFRRRKRRRWRWPADQSIIVCIVV